ncbi:MAG TPA: hypothetical protein VI916_08505 [Acidimicrobiia bacterium]|nr:hypothetical protein [Acidimicrobiia bacterium]
MTAPSTTSVTLQAALERREGMASALTRLEDVLTSHDAAPSDVVAAVAQVRDELCAHVAVVEDPDEGLFREVTVRAPRLVHHMERLRRDHLELVDLAGKALAAAERLHDPPLPELMAFVHSEASALATRLRAHRRVGARLVYEAYDVDLGGGD